MKTAVLKVLCITLVLFMTTTALITEAAFSIPLSHGVLITAQTPVASPSPEDTPSTQTIEQPQTSESPKAPDKAANSTQKPADKELVDSEQTKPKSEKKPSPSAGPYDMKRIRQFNRALYGS